MRRAKNYVIDGYLMTWKNVHGIKSNKNIIKQYVQYTPVLIKIKMCVTLNQRPERWKDLRDVYQTALLAIKLKCVSLSLCIYAHM